MEDAERKEERKKERIPKRMEQMANGRWYGRKKEIAQCGQKGRKYEKTVNLANVENKIKKNKRKYA